MGLVVEHAIALLAEIIDRLYRGHGLEPVQVGGPVQLQYQTGGTHLLFQSLDAVVQHHASLVDDLDPGTGLLHLGQDVGRQNHAVLLAQLTDQLANLANLQGIQADRRLIQDDHGGHVQDGLGDTHPLLIPLGQIADQP